MTAFTKPLFMDIETQDHLFEPDGLAMASTDVDSLIEDEDKPSLTPSQIEFVAQIQAQVNQAMEDKWPEYQAIEAAKARRKATYEADYLEWFQDFSKPEQPEKANFSPDGQLDLTMDQKYGENWDINACQTAIDENQRQKELKFGNLELLTDEEKHSGEWDVARCDAALTEGWLQYLEKNEKPTRLSAAFTEIDKILTANTSPKESAA